MGAESSERFLRPEMVRREGAPGDTSRRQKRPGFVRGCRKQRVEARARCHVLKRALFVLTFSFLKLW